MRGILYILVGVLFCILFTHLCDRLLVWDGVVWGGCSWVYGAYRLGWDVVKWPGEKGERVVRLRSPKEAGINV